MPWTKIKHRLENEYLAPSLRGRITYFATSYSKCPDHEGRAAILLDGEEILEGSYREQWSIEKISQFPKDEKYEKRLSCEFPYMDDTALKLGQFDQRQFYIAYHEFIAQSIEDSLESENMLVRIFAVLDKRVGKRRLEKMKETAKDIGDVFSLFLKIRCEAEGIHF